MKAVILCAGRGTRLRPVTDYLPKAMVPVAGVPLLERIIVNLREQRFTDLLVALSWKAEQVTHHFGDGTRFGVTITYAIHEEAAGTAGELHRMREMLEGEEAVLVHYGDILTDLDLRAMAADHERHHPAATLGLVTGVRIHTGVADMSQTGEVRSFVEKPPLERPANAAVFVLGRGALGYCGPGKDFSNDVFPELIEAGESVRGFVDESAYWLDVGRLADLDRANEFFGGAQS